MNTNKLPGVRITRDRLRFRQATAADVNFIFSSWLKSNRFAPAMSDVQNPVYFSQHHLLVEGLLVSANVLVAVNPDDVAQIYGYICYEAIEDAPVVHFMYIKESFRGLGMGHLMLQEAGIDIEKPFFITHRTKTCKLSEKSLVLVYNPYLAYYAFKVGREARHESLVNPE